MSLPADLKYWPEAKQSEYLKSLPKMELLDALVELSEDLYQMVCSWDDLILDGLDEKLATDQSSKEVADQFLKRISS
ncbi:MAG TPA: hypothetical protein VIY47_01840 [Ignavibacteriaceae bacterium]